MCVGVGVWVCGCVSGRHIEYSVIGLNNALPVTVTVTSYPAFRLRERRACETHSEETELLVHSCGNGLDWIGLLCCVVLCCKSTRSLPLPLSSFTCLCFTKGFDLGNR